MSWISDRSSWFRSQLVQLLRSEPLESIELLEQTEHSQNQVNSSNVETAKIETPEIDAQLIHSNIARDAE